MAEPRPLIDALIDSPRDAPPAAAVERLVAAGVSPAALEAAALRDVAAAVGDEGRRLLTVLVEAALGGQLLDAPDAGLALRGIASLIEREHEDGDIARATVLCAAAEEPTVLGRLVRLLGQAPPCTESLVRDGEALAAALAASGSIDVAADSGPARVTRHREAIVDALAAAGPGEDAAATVLARHRRAETLSIFAREFVAGETIGGTGLAQSDLADAVIGIALGVAAGASPDAVLEASGTPGFCVLALGKLGGRELNYSSDVDLVYVFDDDGLDTAAAGEASWRWEKLTRALGRILSRQTDAGPIFRVDTRLRPDGAAGPLVRGGRSLLRYLEQRGRAWERQAWLRARPVAGDLDLGRRITSGLAPFVFDRPLESDAIGEIIRLRRRVKDRASGGGLGARGEAAVTDDIKEGPGGIRDCEACVQFLQLLHGGADPSVRSRGTLDGASRLLAARLLSENEADAIVEAYALQRRLEHALQTERTRESWRLPPPGPVRRRLARRLGFDDEASFDARVGRVRARAAEVVRGLLDGLFGSEGRHEQRSAPESDLVLAPSPSPTTKASVLQAHGFRDPAGSHRHLVGLGREDNPLLRASRRAQTYLAGVAPKLLAAIGKTPDPDRTLLDLGRITSTLGAKATFLQLLAADRDALQLFVELASTGGALVETLCRHPGVFDEVLDRLQAARPTDATELGRELDEEARRAADPSRAIIERRAIELLLIGIRDIAGRANAANTMRDLSTLAEAVLRARLGLVRRAEPGGDERADDGFAVITVGRLGSREMLYASDLDLVFVTDPARAALPGAEAAVRFEARAQALTRLIGQPGMGLLPNPVDARLRPMGSKSNLAVTRSSLRDYLVGDAIPSARLWERLAFTRARAVAGDPGLGAEVDGTIREAILERDAPDEVWRETLSMRRRQVATTRGRDLKRGHGGLADVEFLAAALALTHGRGHPELLAQHTKGRLDAARSAGLIDDAEHRTLITAYQLFASMLLRLRLTVGRPVDAIPDEGPPLRRLALLLGYVDTKTRTAEASFTEEVDYHADAVREIFETVAAREGER